jgi:hypothetical protein
MRATFIGATLCATTFMALPTQAQSLNDGVGAGKSPVQIEVRRAQDEDGPVRGAMRRSEPTTTGSGAIGSAMTVSNVPECKVITVRSPQAGDTAIVRKLRQCF